MRHFTKICLLVSFVFFFLGFVCLGAGFALGSSLHNVMGLADEGALDWGGWHFGRWQFFYDGEEEEAMDMIKGMVSEQFLASDVENLELDIRYGELILVDSDTDKIEIHVDAPKSCAYKCGMDGETLRLIDKTSRGYWRISRKGKITITVAIPEGKVFQEVDLDTAAGRIQVSHMLAAESIDLDLGAGELTADSMTASEAFDADVGAGSMNVRQLTAGTIDVDCGVGEVTLGKTLAESIDADCGLGHMELCLAGSEHAYDFDIECGLGAVDIGEKSYSSLTTQKSIDNNADREVDLKCGLGEINVIFEEE